MTSTRNIFLPSILLIFTSVIFSCKKPNPTYEPSYSRFKINQISLTAIPMTDAGGSSWDLGISGYQYPDVYVMIEDTVGSLLFDGSTDVRNDLVSSALPITFTPNAPIQIEDLSAINSISVYDDDIQLTADDLMGKLTIKLADYKSGYPTSITLTSSGTTVIVNGTWY
jgi:hypothetical protein